MFASFPRLGVLTLLYWCLFTDFFFSALSFFTRGPPPYCDTHSAAHHGVNGILSSFSIIFVHPDLRRA